MIAGTFALSRVLLGAIASYARWQPIPPLPRGLAGGAIAVAHDGTVVVAGGTYWAGGRRRYDAALYALKARDGGWRRVGELPQGRAYGGTASDGESLFLAGGETDKGATDAISRIDLRSYSVRTIGRLPQPRTNCGAAFLNGELWVAGGTAVAGDFSGADARLLMVDPATGAVRKGPPAPTAGWVNPAVVALEGSLWIFSGSEWAAGEGRLVAPESLLSFEPRAGRWERRSWPIRLPRGMGALAISESQVLLGGGATLQGAQTQLSAAAWIYDLGNGKLRPAAPLPRRLLAFVWVKTAEGIFLAGGEKGPRSRSAEGWQSKNQAGAPGR